MQMMKTDAAEAEWIALLRQKCQETSQREVANTIRYSTGTINQVLHSKYPGSMKNIESAVRGAYMGETVHCPVYGEIKKSDCLSYQRLPFAPTNTMRVRQYKACRNNCPNSQLKPGKKS